MINFLRKRLLFVLVVAAVAGTGVYLLIPKTITPSVVSTNPKDGDVEVLETSQISINFNEKITDTEKSGVSVKFNPDIQFDSTWLTNTFKVIPKDPLQNGSKYSLSVFFHKSEVYKFTFETAAFSQSDIKKFGPSQSRSDYVFGQATKKVVEQYPWYTSLPIKTKDYVIYYDFQQQKFAITFLVPIQSADQQKSLITEAVAKIKAIGVKDPINYYINTPATTTP